MRDGILIIDKRAGMTSHDVVDRARRILKTRRIGHGGTLDPFATGVLILCVNRATRIAQYLTAHEKEYLATIRFGYATDTGDLTGKRLTDASGGDSIARQDLLGVLEDFRGSTMQVPPMYSARKIGGVRLYELARKGQTVERSPKEIEITDIELVDTRPQLERPGIEPGIEEDGCQDFDIRVVCSAGTYIRTLAEDIGAHLRVGAHLRALRRLRSGRCELSGSLTLEELAAKGEGALQPVIDLLGLPVVEMTEEELARIVHGQECARAGEWREGEMGALCSASRTLVGIGEYRRSTGAWHPRAVLGGTEQQP
jgi:tRNA pseudouridine55 synthase